MILTAANGRELIVEIYVTHRCDDEKKSKLRELGIAAIEIDLSGCREVDNQAIVRERLLGLSQLTAINRTWLNNPVIDDLKEEIAADLHREAEAAAAAADRRALALLRAAREQPVEPDHPVLQAAVRIVGELERSGKMRPTLSHGRGFSVPTNFGPPQSLWRSRGEPDP